MFSKIILDYPEYNNAMDESRIDTGICDNLWNNDKNYFQELYWTVEFENIMNGRKGVILVDKIK